MSRKPIRLEPQTLESPAVDSPAVDSPAVDSPKGATRRRRWRPTPRRPIAFWKASLAVAYLVLFGWLLGQIFREGFIPTQLLFFMPSPVAALLILALSSPALKNAAGRRWGGAALASALIPLAFTFLAENHFGPNRALLKAESLRLVYWNGNGGRPDSDRKELVRQLEALDGDLYLFGEVGLLPFLREIGEGPSNPDPRTLVTQDLPPMVTHTRDETRDRGVTANSQVALVRQVTWESLYGPIELMFVDVASHPLYPRAEVLDLLNLLIEKHRPDLVVGDFNSPRRSKRLQNLPEGYRHAYDEVGSGWSYTFPTRPLPWPLFAIDQCILGPRLEARSFDFATLNSSNHRAIAVEFGLKP